MRTWECGTVGRTRGSRDCQESRKRDDRGQSLPSHDGGERYANRGAKSSNPAQKSLKNRVDPLKSPLRQTDRAIEARSPRPWRHQLRGVTGRKSARALQKALTLRRIL